MTEYNKEQLLELFDGKEKVPPKLPQDDSEASIYIPSFADNAEATLPSEKKRRRKKRPDKKNGVMALPVYKATYDTYKECRFRFRKCTRDTKDICREVTGNLKKIMVNIELFHWQVKPPEILSETLDKILETIIIIRAMKDFGELSTKDYAIICQYSSLMITHMMKWNKHYNANNRKTEKGEHLL